MIEGHAYRLMTAAIAALLVAGCASPQQPVTEKSARQCRHADKLALPVSQGDPARFRDVSGRWVLIGRHAYKCPCAAGLAPQTVAESNQVSGAAEGAEIAGSGEGARVAGNTEGAEIAGSGEGASVAGAGEGAGVEGASEGADVAGAAEGSGVAGAGEGAQIAGGTEGSDIAGASASETVAGATEGTQLAGGVSQLACRDASGPLGFRLLGTRRPAYYVEQGLLYRIRGADAVAIE